MKTLSHSLLIFFLLIGPFFLVNTGYSSDLAKSNLRNQIEEDYAQVKEIQASLLDLRKKRARSAKNFKSGKESFDKVQMEGWIKKIQTQSQKLLKRIKELKEQERNQAELVKIARELQFYVSNPKSIIFDKIDPNLNSDDQSSIIKNMEMELKSKIKKMPGYFAPLMQKSKAKAKKLGRDNERKISSAKAKKTFARIIHGLLSYCLTIEKYKSSELIAKFQKEIVSGKLSENHSSEILDFLGQAGKNLEFKFEDRLLKEIHLKNFSNNTNEWLFLCQNLARMELLGLNKNFAEIRFQILQKPEEWLSFPANPI